MTNNPAGNWRNITFTLYSIIQRNNNLKWQWRERISRPQRNKDSLKLCIRSHLSRVKARMWFFSHCRATWGYLGHHNFRSLKRDKCKHGAAAESPRIQLEARSSVLPTSSGQRFQSPMIFHGLRDQSASFTEKDEGGAREAWEEGTPSRCCCCCCSLWTAHLQPDWHQQPRHSRHLSSKFCGLVQTSERSSPCLHVWTYELLPCDWPTRYLYQRAVHSKDLRNKFLATFAKVALFWKYFWKSFQRQHLYGGEKKNQK